MHYSPKALLILPIRNSISLLFVCLFCLATSVHAQKATDASKSINAQWLNSKPKAQWIWSKSPTTNQKLWFRTSFDLDSAEVKSATLYATCDNQMTMWMNGKKVGASDAWETPLKLNVNPFLVKGKNVIAIEGANEGGVAGIVLKLDVTQYGKGGQPAKLKALATIVSDVASWKFSEEKVPDWEAIDFDDSAWKKPVKVGTLGGGPWNLPGLRSATPVVQLNSADISAPEGFVVEPVYTVPKEQGSWVSMATDPQGRIYASDQGGAGLYRMTVQKNAPVIVEKVSVNELSKLSGAQGLLWAFDSLWFHRNGGHLYRLTDSNGDDQLDSMTEIPSTTGGGEHGNHALILTEDEKGIFVDSGNHSKLAAHTASRVQSWAEDLLLPRMPDSNGHANGIMAPGGWVTRLNPKTNEQVVHAIGFRNQYDIALNQAGDLFTYDADMEWDLGSPWYRPTRICHVVSGADFGWRHGSGKWPAYYEDSLPAVVDIGPGSPTGVVSGAGLKFPTRFQNGLFALDWTFGTIYSIDLKSMGAGYTGTAEPFVYSSPLPVTDAIVGHDGALYFAVGGRGAQSAVFRVRYVGGESCASPGKPSLTKAQSRRRALEEYHGVINGDAVDDAWPELSSEDRFLRHAARVAIESQPIKNWAIRVLAEPNPQARITGAVALARMGDPIHQQPLFDSLTSLSPEELSETQLLGLLRAYSLGMIRLGDLTKKQREILLKELDPLFPNSSPDVNTELIRVLTFLRSETVARKAMELIKNRKSPEIPKWSELISRNRRYGGSIERMLGNHPPTREIGYAFMLRNLREGWTLDSRRVYFEFLNAAAKTAGGNSFAKYLTRIRDEALASCTNAEREALESITGEDFNPVPDFEYAAPVGPGKKWTVEMASKEVKNKSDFERGRSLFFGAGCAQCHRVRGLGGSVGPDLTSVPNKFDRNYVIDTIIHPSRNISDQYSSSLVVLADGRLFEGIVIKQDGGKVAIYPGKVGAEPVVVAKDDIDEIRPSKVSQMPENLLDKLNAQEVNDLMGYLMTGGDANHRQFKK